MDEFIILVSDTEDQSKLFLDAIKRELETNEKIISFFGNLVGKKWGEEAIETKTEIKIMARGAEQKIRGFKHKQHRPTLIVCDDLENEELVSSADRRMKLAQWFNGSAIPSLADSGRLVMIGTILHYDSLLMKMSKDESFKTLFYQAKNDKDEMLWEQKMSLSQWYSERERFKRLGMIDIFYAEYQNDPVNDENSIFKKEWFHYFEPRDENTFYVRPRKIEGVEYEGKIITMDNLNIFMTVDLAISHREHADFTVIMVCGIDSQNNIYVIEYARDHYTPMETIAKIFELHLKYEKSFVRCGIESVGYQRSLQWFVEDEMKRRNQIFALEELTADTDKERRIRGFQPRYAIHSVFHRSHMTELEEELLRFPKSPHDDLVDAMCYLPQIAFRATDPKVQPGILADVKTYDDYMDKVIFSKLQEKHLSAQQGARQWFQLS